jgi:hypothetical protein
MKTIEEFQNFYAQTLRPDLEVFEARRKSIVRKILIYTAIMLGLTGALLAIFYYTMDDPTAGMSITGIVGLILCITGPFLFSGDYASAFKRVIIDGIVKYVDPSLQYGEKRRVEQSEFEDSRLFLHHIDRYDGEDGVWGKLGKTEVEFSEVHAEYKTTSTDSKGNKRTEWHTIFKGLFFIGDFNKNFNGSTVVLPDLAEKLLGGWLGNLLQKWDIGRPEKLVKLEDPDFEKAFVVYGSDQIEARYILTPALMRRLLELQKKAQKAFFVSFVNSKVYVAIPYTQNLFEPRLFSTLLDFGMAKEFYEILAFAADIVEDLNLNTRLWTKQ